MTSTYNNRSKMTTTAEMMLLKILKASKASTMLEMAALTILDLADSSSLRIKTPKRNLVLNHSVSGLFIHLYDKFIAIFCHI